MATNKANAQNIDNSDPANYPNARIKDNDGTGNGTPVNRLLYSDMHEYFAKLMRLAAIAYNGVPENEGNGYQLIDATIALAGKNDFITPLVSITIIIAGTNTKVISIPLALSTLKLNEAIVCKVNFNLSTETQIQGTEAALLKNITAPSAFKSGDYIRLIVTSSGITLIRLADGLNLDVLVTELNYLKATTAADEYTGATQLAATTPYTNQLAFARRVIGVDSSIFLASTSRNGLMSAADKVILAGIAASPIKNTGWVSGIDVAGVTPGANLPVGGDISAATALGIDIRNPAAQEFQITFAHAMADTNYFVQVFGESQTISANYDASICLPVFRNKTINGCTILLREIYPITQSLKLHIQVVKIG